MNSIFRQPKLQYSINDSMWRLPLDCCGLQHSDKPYHLSDVWSSSVHMHVPFFSIRWPLYVARKCLLRTG